MRTALLHIHPGTGPNDPSRGSGPNGGSGGTNLNATRVRVAGTDILVAGLDWMPADSHGGASAGRRLPGGNLSAGSDLSAGSASLVWRGARANLPSTGFSGPNAGTGPDGAGSALVQMCLGFEAAGQSTAGFWLWVAPVSARNADGDLQIIWWLGGTQDGAPSQVVPEEMHDSAAAVVNALAGIAATAEITGIAMTQSAHDELTLAMVPQAAQMPELPELRAPVICTPAPLEGTMPRFVMNTSGRAGVRTLLATLAVAAGLGIAWTTGMFSAPPAPAPLITRYIAPVPGAVITACTSAIMAPWPRAPGWSVRTAGCARPGYLPDNLRRSNAGAGDLVVWRAYHRESAANAVLAGAAADKLLADWGGRHAWTGPGTGIGRTQLILWQIAPLVTEEINPGVASPQASQAPQVSQAPQASQAPIRELARLLAEAWADEPGAVRTENGLLKIDVAGPPAGAFARLAESGLKAGTESGTGNGTAQDAPLNAELLSITWTGTRTTLRLRPRTGEEVI